MSFIFGLEGCFCLMLGPCLIVFLIELFHIFHVVAFYRLLFVIGFLIVELRTIAYNCLHPHLTLELGLCGRLHRVERQKMKK